MDGKEKARQKKMWDTGTINIYKGQKMGLTE